MRKLILSTILALAVLFSPFTVWAVDIIQDTSNTGSAFINEPKVGQSFTAVASQIETISFYYEDWNTNRDTPLATMTLRQGDDPSGQPIGSVTENLTGIYGWADFDFSGYQLLVGNSYTITIEIPGGRGSYHRAMSDTYPGGIFYYNETGNTDRDLQFRVLGRPVCTVIEIADGEIEIECPSGETLTVDDFSCTSDDNQDGTYTISCGDGTSVVVSDGEDGSSCTVEDQGDGTHNLSCDDGTSATISDGEDGTSCTVESHEDGSATILCEDGTSYTVEDGEDGASCDAFDNEDGTYIVECDDSDPIVIRDGQDGQDGSSCTIEHHEDDDSALISCEDGSSFTVQSGQDGADGGCSSINGNGDPANLVAFLMLLGAFATIRRRRA